MLRLFSILAFALLTVADAGFTPELARILPQGIQRGTEIDINLRGNRLEAPEEILFHKSGIEVLKLEAKDPKHVIARIRISPDAELGEHPLRLRTKGGVTFLRSLWVGQFSTLEEKEPNNSFEAPQKVSLNSTVQGLAKTEDEDVYSVNLKKGEALSVEVEAMRLGRLFFDAYVAILDPKRFELAACDDSPLLYTDASASIIAPEDGEYRIVVREAAYEGNDQSAYRLHIGSFPRPSAAFPPGAKPGETLDFRFIGDPSGELTRSITIPPDASGRFPVFAERGGLFSPSPNWIEVSPLEHLVETEPNEGAKAATPAPAIPFAVHGLISKEKDVDWYRFAAKKGQNLDFNILARGLRSPLDSVIGVHDSKGKGLANNDDQGSPDSILKWTCPADGDYFVSVRDKLMRSGPDFFYRLEATTRAPSISATLPVAERNKSQVRKVISVPRGNRYATVVNIARSNLGCDALFDSGPLPAGMSMHVPEIPRSLTSFPVVFEAQADAAIAGGYVPFTIRSTGDKAPQVSGPLKEEIHHVEVNNQGPYHSTFSEKIAVAIIEEAPFTITLETPPTPIVQRGILKLKVRAHRQDGFDEAINLRFLWNPPGIGSPTNLKLEKGKNEIDYEINANADAPGGEWQVCVLADANTAQGPVFVSSSLVPLKVVEPWVTATIDLSATEQSRNVPVLCKLEYLTTFKGKAKAELMGLPHGTKTKPIEFPHGTADLTFPIEVAKDAAVGKHNGLFLRIDVPDQGTTILHQTGHGGTLRIDKPSQKEVAAKPKADKAKENKPAAKPLSRLEQLRQKAP
ncbi:pre-peptidase C-terminal domain-containing protein [Haloferula chungangensis]|uniref:Pre-peptidase C-terminal domain-containing protein n=1 Tax=Haloferula chungangensis TaxID=1048331 RepID=A0ABW2L8V0_9BACT